MSIKNILAAGAIIVASATLSSAGTMHNGLINNEKNGPEIEMIEVGANYAAICRFFADQRYERGTNAWNNYVNNCLNSLQN